MVSFENDYNAGCHPKILQRLVETNMEKLSGYGSDCYTKSAREKIRLACGRPDAQVELLTGGTQTNAAVISTMLRDWEAVISPATGHICTHEAGAIEYSGHEVLEMPEHDGKLDASELERFMKKFYGDDNHEHMTFPGMVYISFPTEFGTIYSKDELTALYSVCRKYAMPLYIDGARLGYGLMSSECDLTLPEMASLCDVMYIGGTKVGAICGEAVVFTHDRCPEHFLTQIKRRGALLAKGRLLGIQFDTLFTDNLYFDISGHAIRMAEKMKEIIRKSGVPFFMETCTNQQFIILTQKQIKQLERSVAFSFWENLDDGRTAVRLVASWATTGQDLEELEKALSNLQ